MADQFSRTRMLLGREALDRLGRARVLLLGVGGVGGHAAEALVRSGVGALDMVDGDRVSLSNLNRQLFALHSTLGQYKAEAARERLLDIAPQARVEAFPVFYGPESWERFDLSGYDYIVDAVDDVAAKVELAVRAERAGTPLISAMGAGNKLDPGAFRVGDIYKTSVCPLARVMRRELRRRGVKHLQVVWSPEEPIPPRAEDGQESEDPRHRSAPGSVAFVPAAAGLVLAGAVVRSLCGLE